MPSIIMPCHAMGHGRGNSSIRGAGSAGLTLFGGLVGFFVDVKGCRPEHPSTPTIVYIVLLFYYIISVFHCLYFQIPKASKSQIKTSCTFTSRKSFSPRQLTPSPVIPHSSKMDKVGGGRPLSVDLLETFHTTSCFPLAYMYSLHVHSGGVASQ